MGKIHILLMVSALIVGAGTTVFAHSTNPNPEGDYENPNCEGWQTSHLEHEADVSKDNGAWTCEGEHWDGQADYVSDECDLHKSASPDAGIDGWCVAVATSSAGTGMEDGNRWDGSPTNGLVDVATAGDLTDGAEAYAGVSIIMVGQTSVGVDACVVTGASCNGDVFADAAWYGEDETDKSPAGAFCQQLLPENPTTDPHSKNNCLAYAFQSSGLVHAQIGDDPEHADCPPGEYDQHVHDDDQAAQCRRDNTSIGAGVAPLMILA